MRTSVRFSLFAAMALLAPVSAVAAPSPPTRLVCQLDKQGLTVEATFDKNSELSKDLRVFRQGPGLAQVTRIAKEEVTAQVGPEGLRLGVDREVAGQTKRVLYLSWSATATKIDVLSSVILPHPLSGMELPARVEQANIPCKVYR